MQSFWHIDIGNLSTWAGVALTIIFYVSRQSAKLLATMSKFEHSVEYVVQNMEKLAIRIDVIDNTGTKWSQGFVAKESELSKSNARRLDQHEATLQAISPALAAARADLDWLKPMARKTVSDNSNH